MDDTRTADRLWADYARTHDPRTREAIIHQFERLAYSIANRFTQRGVESEDLFQVALMGLVKAVDRFDPTTHYRFSTFATPTILGELRRYFRDHSWNVHVPRGLQEFSQQVNKARRQTTERLGRAPTNAELARALSATEEQVVEAVGLEEANRPVSLDGAVEASESGRSTVLEECLGRIDPELRNSETRVSVRQAIGHLPSAHRDLIRMRYLEGLSQREVARQLGMSQMQVSRQERRAMDELRQEFLVR
jgi:RNA polymerase sigma-B factor